MSLPCYGEYKDSGVAWLGEVPAHWNVTCVKRLTSRISSGKTPLGGSEIYVDEGVVFLRSQNVYDEGLRLDDVVFISQDVDETMAVSRVRAGDILLNITGASIGRSCVVPKELPSANVNQHVCAVRLSNAAQISFVGWFFKSDPIKNQIDFAQNGAAREGLNFDQIGRMALAVATLPEQEAIAAFLDRETGKIDALIAEQEKLLTLLAEKRQATISHAVTRGLDPNAPVKDSCVPWLGEVPAHWKALALRRLIDQFEQGWSPECEARPADPGEWGVLKAGCVNGGEFDAQENKTLPLSLVPREELELKSGDVLMSRASGSPKLIGSVACVMNPPSHLMLSDKIFRIRLSADVDPRFFAVAMGSTPLRQQIEQAIGGAEGLANNLPQASIKEFWMSLPPVEEQLAIVDFLVCKRAKLDDLAGAAERAIALLKERRSALIAAAVTGKVDVRH